MIILLDDDGQPTDLKGKWYAGGTNIYVRFPPKVLPEQQLEVWHILDISRDRFRVRPRKGEIMIWRRMKPPAASNHSMKPTAPLRSNLSMFATTPCRGLSLSR